MTDANGTFGMTVDIVRYLQLGRLLPGLLVVGIGYPVAGFRGAQLPAIARPDPDATRRAARRRRQPAAERRRRAVPGVRRRRAAAGGRPALPDRRRHDVRRALLRRAVRRLHPARAPGHVRPLPAGEPVDLVGRPRHPRPHPTRRRRPATGDQTSVAILVGEEETPEGRRAAAIAAGASAPDDERPRPLGRRP